MLNFAWPWVLALIAVPVLSHLWQRHRAKPVAAPVLPTATWLAALPGVSSHGQAGPRWQRVLLFLIWSLLVIAAARPQQVGESIQMPVTGRDLMLAVDLSPSMAERDMIMGRRAVDRLEAVKLVIDDFIAQRQGDRIGLIVFGAEAYVYAPLTFDHATIKSLLAESRIGMAGRATAIGDTIGLAVKRLRDRPQQQRVLILLSDGANTAGQIDPRVAAEIAAAAGVRIYTVGVAGDPPATSGFGGMRRPNPGLDLDEELLTDIAAMTGGRYFRARSTPELQQVYESLNLLEPVELESRYYRPTREQYVWPAGAAALLLTLLWLAEGTRGHLQRRREHAG
ncbi:MAG: VWA domain-containing protein [Marinobacter sp.]|nr:VWA domain-containing protein [Marinobacter sp.]